MSELGPTPFHIPPLHPSLFLLKQEEVRSNPSTEINIKLDNFMENNHSRLLENDRRQKTTCKICYFLPILHLYVYK